MDFLDEDDDRPKRPDDPPGSADDPSSTPPDETSILPPEGDSGASEPSPLPPEDFDDAFSADEPFAPGREFADDSTFAPGAEPFAEDESFGSDPPFAEEEPFGAGDELGPGDEPPFGPGGVPGAPGEGPPSAPGRRRRDERRPERQQIVLRRLLAVGVGVMVVLLFGLGLKACFNARNKSALRDYVDRTVTPIVADSQQTGEQFFKTLSDPQGLTPLDYQNEIKSDRGAAEALVTRAESADVPGDMAEAQRALVLTLELRRDGLRTIAEAVPTALAREGRAKAISDVATAMRSFLASDVVYARVAKPSMEAVLAKNDVGDAKVPDSQFLPEAPDWLSVATVSGALSKVAGSSTTATPGTHGLGLIGASIGGVALQEGTPAQIPAAGTPELELQVQNQGSVEETDIGVTVTISGGGPSNLEATVPRIAPQETQTVAIPITPKPPSGTQLTISVEIQPVAGEQFQDNNRASYTVTFG